MLSRFIYLSTILFCIFLHPAAMAGGSGGDVYNTYCAVCHKTGLNAAPKYGDAAQWQERIAKGKDTLYKHAIEGFKNMPPRGGYSNLSDEEVKAGVDYMVGAAGGWGE